MEERPAFHQFLFVRRQKLTSQRVSARIKKMILEIILIFVMLISAIAAGIFKDLLNAVIAAGFVSFIAAILFYFLHAPDVAMAEASIGAALTVAIFIIAIRRTERFEEDEKSD